MRRANMYSKRHCMLSVNELVEMVSFNDGTFDESEWNMNVVPRLECNIYRKRFPSIQQLRSPPPALQSWREAWQCSPANRIWY
jgi:hypothetical protein